MKKQYITIMITKRAHDALKKLADKDRRSIITTIDILLGV